MSELANKNEKKKHLSVLIGASLYQLAFHGIVGNTVGVVMAQIKIAFDLNTGYVANFTTIRGIADAVMAVYLMNLFFKSNPKTSLLLSFLAFDFAYLALSFAPKTILWYLLPILMAPGASIGSVGIPYIIKKTISKNSGTATGLVLATSGIAGALLNPLTAKLIKLLGWKETVYTWTAFGLVVGCIGVYLMFKDNDIQMLEPDKLQKTPKANFSAHKASFVICTLCLAGGCVSRQIVDFVSIYATSSLERDLEFGAALTSAVMIGNIAGKLIFGLLYDKLGIWMTMAVVSCSIGFGSAGMIWFSGNDAMLAVSAFLIGYTYVLLSLGVSNCSIEIYGFADSKGFTGYHSGINCMIRAITTFAIGASVDAIGSYRPSFLIAALASTVSGIIALWYFFDVRKKSKIA